MKTFKRAERIVIDGLPETAGRRELTNNETRNEYYQAHRRLRAAWVYWCIRPRSETWPTQHLNDCRTMMNHIISRARYQLYDIQGYI